MPIYDNMLSDPDSTITGIGEKLVMYRNNWFIDKINYYGCCDKEKVLEIGPGKGFFAMACRERNLSYNGIELNKLLASALQEQGYEVVNGEVPPIPGDNKYSTIYMNQVLEHMPSTKKAVELFESCYQHLYSKGLIIISTPDYGMWKEDFFIGDYTHQFPVSSIRLKQMISDSGYQLLEYGYYTLTFSGFLKCKIIEKITKLSWSTGLMHLFFRKKAYKIKSSLLPSLYCIAIKK